LISVESWMRDRIGDTTLGPKSERVLRMFATQPEFTSYASASAIARRAGVDAATVVRTARNLGFSGWPELRLELRNRYLASLNASEVLSEHNKDASDPILRAIRSDLDQVALLARTVDTAEVRNIASAIARSRRTIVIASGAFSGPAYQLAHVAAFSGVDIEFVARGGTTLTNALARLGPGDCLVAINFWRLLREICVATQIAYEAGVTTCVITDLRQQPITEVARHQVIVPCEGTSHFPSLTPAMAVVHGMLAEIAKQLGDAGRRSTTHIEALWTEMGVMYEP